MLFVIGTLATGGAEQQLVNLSQGMHATGNCVLVVSIFPGGQNTLELGIKGDVRFESLWKTKSKNILVRLIQIALSFLLLRRRIREFQPNFVYSMLYMSNLISWIATRGKYSHRLIWGIRTANMKLNWKRALPERICAFLSPSIPLAIANSNAGMRYHKTRSYAPKKFTVIPNGIDTARFRYNEKERIKKRAEYGILPNQTLFGIVARLDPVKDHPTFLRAAKLVAREIESAAFLCVGGGSLGYTRELYQLTEELGLEDRVIWLGRRSDTASIYSALDILVSSSLVEGFSNVIAEAMSCQLPCVVTSVGDSSNIIGNFGLTIEPSNEVELAKAMLASPPRHRSEGFNVLARNRIKDKFSIAAMVERTESELDEIYE